MRDPIERRRLERRLAILFVVVFVALAALIRFGLAGGGGTPDAPTQAEVERGLPPSDVTENIP